MIIKNGEKMFNPIDWAAWIYGKWFQNRPNIGLILFSVLGCFITCLVIIVIWLRGIDKYNQDIKKKDNSSITSILSAASQISQLPENDQLKIIVSNLEMEYMEKHNTRPPIDWINKRLKEEGYNFIIKLKPV